jgi:hypothetical protein
MILRRRPGNSGTFRGARPGNRQQAVFRKPRQPWPTAVRAPEAPEAPVFLDTYIYVSGGMPYRGVVGMQPANARIYLFFRGFRGAKSVYRASRGLECAPVKKKYRGFRGIFDFSGALPNF